MLVLGSKVHMRRSFEEDFSLIICGTCPLEASKLTLGGRREWVALTKHSLEKLSLPRLLHDWLTWGT